MKQSLSHVGNVLRNSSRNTAVVRSACQLCQSRTLSTSRRLNNAAASRGLPVPRPDYSSIIEDPEKAASNIIRRRSPLSPGHGSADSFVQEIVQLHEQVRSLSNQVKDLRSERNTLSAVFSNKKSSQEDKEKARKRAEEVRSQLQGQDGLETHLAKQEEKLLSLGIQLPNATSSEAPQGGYDACQVVKTSNPDLQETSLPAADHVDLLTKLGWLYLPSHITGSSWPYLVGGGALLEMSLTQYAISKALKAGYELVLPPDVVKSEIMRRCGFNPRDAGGEAQTYFVSTSASPSGDVQDGGEAESELALAATSEVPLAAYFMDGKYSVDQLPKKVLAFGHAFRAEAGARGRESRGLYRVHQFSKVELFSVTSSEDGQSERMLQEMTSLQWDILSDLHLPLRMLGMSTEELGASAFQKFDIEAWMPGRGSWGELASASNCTSYQARRLNIRHTLPTVAEAENSGQAVAAKSSKTTYCHTLNATAVAIPRLIVALVENGARFDENGKWTSLELPKALRQYWLGKESLSDTSQVALNATKGSPKSIDIVWI